MIQKLLALPFAFIPWRLMLLTGFGVGASLFYLDSYGSDLSGFIKGIEHLPEASALLTETSTLLWSDILFKVMVWLNIVTLLPILLYPFSRHLIAQKSNTSNAMLLIGYSMVSLLITWLIASPYLEGTTLACLLFGSTPLTIWIHYQVCSWLEILIN